MCHRSLSSFKREFQRCYGMPPGRWLLERRLERASALLNTTSMNVTQIAFECGFESSSHFSRAFKDKFGRTPRTFRDVSSIPA
jgi:transcriptional regulator GlxA family with amidase domain